MTDCLCGATDCPRCYPWRAFHVAECPECGHPHDADTEPQECERCAADMATATVRPEKPGDFDPS